MRTLSSGRHVLAALVSLPLLGISLAAAQDAEVQAKVELAHNRYEEALTKGDADALTAMFAEDAIYMPLTGGTYRGSEEIRNHLEQSPTPESVEIRGTSVEPIGENMILDIGTFTMKLPDQAGGTVEGEYIALAEEADGGLKLRRLISFPDRKPIGSGQ